MLELQRDGHHSLLYFLIMLAMSFLLSFEAGFTQAQTLVLNDTNGPPFTTPEGDGFLDVVAGKAFKDTGLTLKLIKTPAERALRNANEGIDDGELTRIKGINKTYPNLIRVPEKLVEWKFVALTRNSNITIRNWDDLKEYNIGFIRGWKILENNTKQHQKINIVRGPTELFSMLDKNRIDIALYAKWMGLAIVKKNNIQGIRVIEPPLAMREMYIYLNKEHYIHVNKIANALKKIKASGEYERLFNQKVRQSYKQ